ncbi:MAG: hypothetical protein HQ582_06640 [Planctomycetes bacterium]|nr:hypothetical protein [Planctomycetota bacterium]
MFPTKRDVTFLVLSFVLLAGCGRSESALQPVSPSTPTGSAGSQFLLAAEPAEARSVREVREDADDGQPVVVVGRIGGDVSPWVDGLAAFSIVDASLAPCNEIEGDNCPTPWDYCCEADLAKARTAVRVVDEEGKIVPTSAKDLLNIKELQTVVVEGTAKRDEAGNVIVLATGVYVRP